jgi:lipopolysaccharide export system protein LptC
MASFDNTHSRLVFWLKIILPLMALAVLSTLFLFSRRIDTDVALPYAEVDVEELAREQQLTAPEYSGVTADGSSVNVRAVMARPALGDQTGATAEGLTATIEMRGGTRADLTAAAGKIDTAAGKLDLTGGVIVTLSSGYSLTTPQIEAELDRTLVIAPQEVVAEAPYGHITAGGLRLSANDGDAPNHLLVFNNGVKLIYDPPK